MIQLKGRYLIVLLLLIQACDYLPWNQSERVPIARVNDRFLYVDEVEALIPIELHDEDSLLWVRQYVDQWARNQVMLSKASFNLGDQVKEIEDLVQDYRDDLIKFRYQEAMVDKYLDTTVTLQQIQEYFEQNSFNFELKENIVRASYIITVAGAPDLDDAKKLLRSGKVEDLEELEDYALKYANAYSLKDSSWISFAELTKKIPVQSYNQQEFLQRNSFVELEDGVTVYLLRIWDYKIKDGMSPLPYVRSTIKSIILNQRRRSLLDQLEQDLVDEAIQNKEYEFFD